MNDLPETKNDQDNFEKSTLFAPPEQGFENEKVPKARNLTRVVIVACVLLVCVAVAAAGIKIFSPKDEQEISENPTVSVAVTEYESADVEKLTVTTDSYKAVLYSAEEETETNSSTINWYIEGVDKSLTSSTAIDTAVSTAVGLTAVREMTDKQANYGFAKPYATVEVSSRNQKFEAYTITVGAVSPAKSGYYVKTSLSDKVYLVDNDVIQGFCKDIYGYPNTTVMSAFSKTEYNEKYFTEENLTSFDRLTLSGTDYGRTRIVFVPNENEDTKNFTYFKMSFPYKRDVSNDKISPVMEPFMKGLTCEKCYSYNATSDQLESYNLANPEVAIEISLDGKRRTLKFSAADDGYFALMVDGSNAIYKVSADQLKLGERTAENFFTNTVFAEMLDHFTDIDITVNGQTYDFNIVYTETEEDEEGTFSITAGTKSIKSENFQNLYQQIIGVTLTEVSATVPDGIGEMKIVFTRTDGSRATMEFLQTSNRRYHVGANGQAGGYISDITYKNLVEFVKKAYDGQTVPSLTQG